ncbi:MAG: hypothetical protein Q4A09_05665 [Capnocytophaga felis]|nr:hypothetical protein [Capnocytophaga felis]
MKITLRCEDVSLKNANLIFEQTFVLSKTPTYTDLFEELKQSGLLTQFNDKSAVLVLTSKNVPCIFSYYTKTNFFSEGLAEKKLESLSTDKVFTLQYYSSVKDWKKTFYKWYDNNEYYLWRDGWTNEINYCNKLINEEF